jgi:hypothetical protein
MHGTISFLTNLASKKFIANIGYGKKSANKAG